MHGAASILAKSQLERQSEAPVRLVSFVKPINIVSMSFHQKLLNQLENEANRARMIVNIASLSLQFFDQV